MRGLVIAAAIAMNASMAAANEPVRLYAAGSLRAALTDVSAAFEQSTANKVAAKFGASGLLKDEIAGGAPADLFASANMTHPQALADFGKSGPVRPFARNTLCALAAPGVSVNSATLLERLLDSNVKVGTSTPRADPSGDYAFEAFRKAEALKPGAAAVLEAKALQLTGGPRSPPPPAQGSLYGALVANKQADIFLTYCTNALAARAQYPDQQIIALPDALAVGADYGMTALKDAPPAAKALADFILSAQGQAILAKHGFAPPKP